MKKLFTTLLMLSSIFLFSQNILIENDSTLKEKGISSIEPANVSKIIAITNNRTYVDVGVLFQDGVLVSDVFIPYDSIKVLRVFTQIMSYTYGLDDKNPFKDATTTIIPTNAFYEIKNYDQFKLRYKYDSSYNISKSLSVSSGLGVSAGVFFLGGLLSNVYGVVKADKNAFYVSMALEGVGLTLMISSFGSLKTQSIRRL